jgi:hypothetical protein
VFHHPTAEILVGQLLEKIVKYCTYTVVDLENTKEVGVEQNAYPVLSVI